MRFYT